MIDVGVRERDEVDAPRPGWERRAELGEQPVRVGTAVDERGGAGHLDQIGVALPDVQGDDADRWIGPRRDGDAARDQRGGADEGDAPGPERP